ncbi:MULTISPECIES: helix-turn-helix transcriptional regulator [unclassified Bacillus cereus group]|uniref:helix-turn-helix domain-containing protein n=1 Tax=unclassified Bacillus cereus group TaxID=2750818 RepID=UPI001F5A6D81|nr:MULTISPECIES: helix-turn-helix domain-containing protein [unclassified Bacillus cereus group]MDA1545823.1 helix-turn-helix domain-containing protein [Bacillus cereus group sp. TH253LC]
MIDYSPLHVTLKEKEMVISDLRDEILHSKTIARINKGMSVHLGTIEAICLHLDVPIEKVVKIVNNEEL